MSDMNLSELIELAKWKKSNPEEYREVMEGLGEIIKDINRIMQEALR